MFWAIDPDAERFERGIGEYVGTEYCATFNSDTSALHAGLVTHGIQAGDDNFASPSISIVMANAPPMIGAKVLRDR